MTAPFDLDMDQFERNARRLSEHNRIFISTPAAILELTSRVRAAETALVASQLREKGLRETLKLIARKVGLIGKKSLSNTLIGYQELARLALSRPTDTADADALLARVKDLEATNAVLVAASRGYLQSLTKARHEIEVARALIEESEAALKLVQTSLGHKYLWQEFDTCAIALANIREWKEAGK